MVDEKMMSEEKAGDGKKEWEPRIVGFLCNWCSYAGADFAGTSRLNYPTNIRILRVPCSGRVDPLLVVRAFMEGADGVLVAGCHPGDCHYAEGNYYTRRRYALVHRFLEYLGLEPERLRLSGCRPLRESSSPR